MLFLAFKYSVSNCTFCFLIGNSVLHIIIVCVNIYFVLTTFRVLSLASWLLCILFVKLQFVALVTLHCAEVGNLDAIDKKCPARTLLLGSILHCSTK